MLFKKKKSLKTPQNALSKGNESEKERIASAETVNGCPNRKVSDREIALSCLLW